MHQYNSHDSGLQLSAIATSLAYRAFYSIDIPFAKKALNGNTKQQLFLVLKVVLHAVVVISEVLPLSTESRCSHCCMGHLCPIATSDAAIVPHLSTA